MNSVATQDNMAMLEHVVVAGDLSKLTPKDRVAYYAQVCQSVGLNPYTKPFAYITLNNKLTLYALRDATDQLRSLRKVSVVIKSREMVDNCYVVTASATMPDGRTDESIGAVDLGTTKGELRANGLMKAETKAKRRVTLSICGLGMLDETEVVTVAGAKPVKVDPKTGEILEPITRAITARGGSEDRLSEIQMRKVQAIVEAMQAQLNLDRLDLAVREFDSSDMDADEQVYCIDHFDAPTRKKLKEEGKKQLAERKAQAEKAANQ